MSDPSTFPGNIEAAFARMEGKIDRLADKMDSAAAETVRLRDRVHEIANELTPLVVIDIPGRLTDHENRIHSLERDHEQRKGAMMVMRGLWALAGFICGGGVIGVIQYLGGMS